MSQAFPITFLDRDTIDALQGSEGLPSETNKYVTQNDAALSDDRVAHALRTSTSQVGISTSTPQGAGYTLVTDSTLNANWEPMPPGAVLYNLNPTSIGANEPAGPGSSEESARGDHKHSIATDSPINIGNSNSIGTSNALSRADHLHKHGALDGGALHALATQTAHGFLSKEDKIRIDTHLNPGSGSISGAEYSSRTDTISVPTSQFLYYTYTTSTADPGEYRYAWSFEQSVTSNNRSMTVTVLIDGVTVAAQTLAAFQSTGRQIGSGFRYIPSTVSQAHTIEVYVQADGAGCNMHRVDLEFWRKS